MMAIQRGALDYLIKDTKGKYLEILPTVVRKTYMQASELRVRLEAQEALRIEKQRLEQQVRRQSALADLQLAINQPAQLQALLESIVDVVTRLLPASVGSSIILWDDTRQDFVTSATTVPQQESRMVAQRVRRHGGATRHVVSTGQPVVVADVAEDPFGANPMTHEYGVRSYVGVPLIADTSPLGVLYALHYEPRTYRADDLDFLSNLAARASLAITKVRLFEDLRQANQQLASQRLELEKRAADLEARNSELDQFAHTVAHDLKSPISNMIGYGDILLAYSDKEADEPLRKALRTIVQSGLRAGRIIDELLLLASIRMEDLAIKAIDMQDIVEDVLQQYAEAAKNREALIQMPDTWLRGMGHGPWIREVWANYVSNGLRYGGDPPMLTLACEQRPDQMVRFWVQDNGPGIAADEQARLFQPFSQLSQVRTKGHGLGLSIVRRILEKCGGRVGVDSEPGQGSRFWFELPAAEENSDPKAERLVS